MSQHNDEPSNLEKAKFFSKTAYDILKGFVSNGNLMVPPEVKQARIDICRECNRFDEARFLCKECGCFLVNKVRFTASSCPLQYW